MKKIFILLTFFLVGFYSLNTINAYYDEDYYSSDVPKLWDNYEQYYFGGGGHTQEFLWLPNYGLGMGDYEEVSRALDFIIERMRLTSSDSTEFDYNIGKFITYLQNEGLTLMIPNITSDNVVSEFGIFDYQLNGELPDYIDLPDFANSFHVYKVHTQLTKVVITFDNLVLDDPYYYGTSVTDTGLLIADSVKYKVYALDEENDMEYLLAQKTIYPNAFKDIFLGFYYITSDLTLIDWTSITHDIFTNLPMTSFDIWHGYKLTSEVRNMQYLYDFIYDVIQPMASNEYEFQSLLNTLKYYLEEVGININLPEYDIRRFEIDLGEDFITLPNYANNPNKLLNIKFVDIYFSDDITFIKTEGVVNAKQLILTLGDDIQILNYRSGLGSEISIRISRPVFRTVLFDVNGGQSIENIVTGIDTYVILPKAERLNYMFVGWTKNALFENIDYATLDPHNLPLGSSGIAFEDDIIQIGLDTTLYAIWLPKIYNVAINLNGGTLERFGKRVDFVSFNVYYNEPITQNIGGYDITQKPYRIGYTFSGYYTEPQFINKFELSTPVTQSITLHTKWVKTLNTAEEDTATRLLSSVGLNFEQGGLLLYVLLNIGLILFSLRYSSKLAWIISVLLLLGFGIFGLIKVVVVIIMGLLLITVLLFLMNKGDSSE